MQFSYLSDDLAAFDRTDLRKQGTDKIFGYRGIQIPDIPRQREREHTCLISSAPSAAY
jgi:hypothetical protein